MMVPNQFLEELRRMQQYAFALRDLMQRAGDCAPQSSSGTDPAGAVTITLDSDGLPDSITVASDWKQRTSPETLANAVTEAFEAASAQRMKEWEEALEEAGWSADFERMKASAVPSVADTGRAVPAVDTARAPWPPRPIDQITEDLLGAFDALDAWAANPSAATGTSAPDGARRCALSLSREHGLRCEIDPKWASGKTGVMLTTALREALAEARESLHEASQSSAANPTAGTDQLFAEVMTLLQDPSRLAPPD